MKSHAKAIAAILGALATSLTAADLSSTYWYVPVITSVVSAVAVYAVPNAAPVPALAAPSKEAS